MAMTMRTEVKRRLINIAIFNFVVICCGVAIIIQKRYEGMPLIVFGIINVALLMQMAGNPFRRQ